MRKFKAILFIVIIKRLFETFHEIRVKAIRKLCLCFFWGGNKFLKNWLDYNRLKCRFSKTIFRGFNVPMEMD